MIDDKNIPLVADLDGTVIKTDILYESLVLLLKKNPIYLFLVPFWLLKGKAYIKQMVVNRIDINVENMPYNYDVIEFIKKEKDSGRKVFLATASNETPAGKLAEHLNIFDGVYATNKDHNLLAENKAKKLVKEFGENQYDYIGDSGNDIKIWEKARYVFMVNPSSKTIKKVDDSKIKRIFRDGRNKPKLMIKEIRVYQWVKNILIFLPLLMAHRFSDINLYLQTFYAFISFSFTASFVYVLNDLMDLESDRKHPRKKNRPIASGKLSVRRGIMLLPLLLAIGISFGTMVGTNFLIVLAVYLILTCSYSFKLKKYYIIDILILSALYSIRLIAGAVAVDVEISHWLLAFSMFIFLSLAFVKRFTEVRVMIDQNKIKTSGRGYLTSDENLLSSLGVGSALMSVLVFLLYANSPEIIELYKHPELFYGIAPFLLYWLIRIWFKAHRDEMHDDPIVFTGKDLTSYIIGLLIAVLVLGAMI